ncbi:MAG: YHS domain-containing protein, partial [Sulfurovum sp.]|nr:YHS domain-containing protein [Sulfurovum sp.]NNJ44864.1 YHS domain-containing protein [Sulfurovum sp.]
MQDKSTDIDNIPGLKDPVCDMTVTEDSDQHIQHDGKDFYFCSSGCKEKFHDDPDKYIYSIKQDSTASLEDYYVCSSGCKEMIHDDSDKYISPR